MLYQSANFDFSEDFIVDNKSIVGFVLSILTTLGINFIPLEMWFYEDFSGAETMVLYALENIVALSLGLLLVRLLAPASDKTLPKTYQSRKEIIGGYALLGYVGCIAASVFIFAFVFVVMKSKISLAEVQAAMKYVLIFQLFGFAIDIVLMRRLTLVGADRVLRKSLSRIWGVQVFGTFLGVLCMAFFGKFVLPFIVMKTLYDLCKTYEFFFGPKTDREYVESFKPNDFINDGKTRYFGSQSYRVSNASD